MDWTGRRGQAAAGLVYSRKWQRQPLMLFGLRSTFPSTCSAGIVIVAVPAEAAQAVVDRVVAAGIRAILNFAPTKLRVPDEVALKNVNMAVELEGLSYALANGGQGPRRTLVPRVQPT